MFSLKSLASTQSSSELSSSKESLTSSDDEEVELKLLYGFGDERPEHYKNSNTPYLYIDHLNNALGITLDELVIKNKISEIKKGLTPTFEQVREFKEQLPVEGTYSQTLDLLQNWANHLKDKFSTISLSKRFKDKDTDSFRYEFFNKNVNLDQKEKIQEILYKYNLEEEFNEHLRLAISKFKSSDEEGFAFLDSIYGQANFYINNEHHDLGLLYNAMGDLFINAFFRKTSKAGIDWVFRNDSPLQNIDFLSYSKKKPLSDNDINKQSYKNASSYQSGQRRPITFSELRHAQRNNYKINKITKAIRSASHHS